MNPDDQTESIQDHMTEPVKPFCHINTSDPICARCGNELKVCNDMMFDNEGYILCDNCSMINHVSVSIKYTTQIDE